MCWFQDMIQYSIGNALQLKELFKALLSENGFDFGVRVIETSRSILASVEVHPGYWDS